MKKILLGLVIILAAAVVVLKIIPVAAKSPVVIAPPENTVGVRPAGIFVPVVASTTAAVVPAVIKKVTSSKVIVPVKKTVQASPAKKVTIASSNSVRWASSGLNAVGGLSSFDYSTKIRNAYMRKVEAYAKSKGITLITAAVVNSMHE
jgi:hypothetical protein